MTKQLYSDIYSDRVVTKQLCSDKSVLYSDKSVLYSDRVVTECVI